MSDESEYLVASWHFEGGLPGTDNDPDNPLSRAARREDLNKTYLCVSIAIQSWMEQKKNLTFFGFSKPGDPEAWRGSTKQAGNAQTLPAIYAANFDSIIQPKENKLDREIKEKIQN